jgi:hypothetical protein
MPDPPHRVDPPTISIPADGSLGAFFEACRSGDLERVTGLVQGHNRPEDYLSRGLLAATAAGQAAVTRYLLEQGGRIEPFPVLLSATRGGSLAVFQALKDHGWDVRAEGYKVLPYVSWVMPCLFVCRIACPGRIRSCGGLQHF